MSGSTRADTNERGIAGATSTAVIPSLSARLWLVILPLSTGAAVLALLLTGVSMAGSAVVISAVGALAAVRVRGAMAPGQRRAVAERIRIGLAAGTVATAAYDISRYGLSVFGRLSLAPFRPFALFGQQFVGTEAPVFAQYAAGTAYHVVNGLGFAVAYTVLARRPKVWTAVLWAGALELFTIALYPSWLRLQALGEFAQISVFGHVAYGLGLGLVARHLSPPEKAWR